METGYNNYASDFSKKGDKVITPNQLRWLPQKFPEDGEEVKFLEGIQTICGAGEPAMKDGLTMHMFSFNASMVDEAFYNSDGDMLFVAQEGNITFRTEFGVIQIAPKEIAVIQRGIKFGVEVKGPVRGYFCELFKGHFVLPDLGPIGTNGLANPRDFETPVAWYEDEDKEFKLINKFCGEYFTATMDHSIYDVVAWHGNYAPYKYDLEKFNTIGSISYDHPDPSIFTVLTAQSDDPGQAVCDFVIFPPRWLVAEHTFRPPYYHRNTMSEFMGNIIGKYDAKEAGFCPGAASLHSSMTAHGPEAEVFEKASTAELKPMIVSPGGMAFMFETCYLLKMTQYAMDYNNIDLDYYKCWKGIPNNFRDEIKKEI
jgi:homogentisate 1,2-dioxygenase